MLIDDFDEFRSMIEAPLARLKIKKFVKQKTATTSSTTDKSQAAKVHKLYSFHSLTCID